MMIELKTDGWGMGRTIVIRRESIGGGALCFSGDEEDMGHISRYVCRKKMLKNGTVI